MKIRIAVAVDQCGCWSAYGDHHTPIKRSSDNAMGEVHDHVPRHLVFVEADVPLPPEPQTVEGTVV